MPGPDKSKYSVLVVDDKPEWVEDVRDGSSIKFAVTKDVGSALASIEKNPNFDLIIVDLFLKNDVGLSLIEKAKERGISIPFVIASYENKDALKNSNGELFERYIESDAIEYLDKKEIGGAKNFERIVTVIIDSFSLAMDRVMKLYDDRLGAITQIAGSISESSAIILTYSNSIGSPSSFRRLCAQIQSDVDNVKRLSSNRKSQSAPGRSKRHARYFDYVPNVTNRLQLQATLKELHRKRQRLDFADDVAITIVKIFRSVLRRNNSEVVTRIFSAYADELLENNDFSNAINVLVSLSDELKKEGKRSISIGVRLLSAHLLEDRGRKAAARVFIQDALADALAQSEREYVGYIEKRFPQYVDGNDHDYD
jgi:CheY-like chemotaxis protein